MVQTFKLDDSEQAKFLIFHSDSHQDEQDYVNQFNLPNDVFALDDISAVDPGLKKFLNKMRTIHSLLFYPTSRVATMMYLSKTDSKH